MTNPLTPGIGVPTPGRCGAPGRVLVILPPFLDAPLLDSATMAAITAARFLCQSPERPDAQGHGAQARPLLVLSPPPGGRLTNLDKALLQGDAVVLDSGCDPGTRRPASALTCSLAYLAAQLPARAILAAAGEWSRMLLPRLARRLGTVMHPDIVDLSSPTATTGGSTEESPLLVRRLSHAGRLMATSRVRGERPLVATVDGSGCMTSDAPGKWAEPTPGEIICVNGAHSPAETSCALSRYGRILPESGAGMPPSMAMGPSISEARVVVAGGRGCGGPETMALLGELAHALGGALGASRAAVDAGWADGTMQIGQTGKSISPDLYIAAGISGAVQHLAAIGRSRTIIAINTDPQAPIMSFADMVYCGDVRESVTALLRRLG